MVFMKPTAHVLASVLVAALLLLGCAPASLQTSYPTLEEWDQAFILNTVHNPAGSPVAAVTIVKTAVLFDEMYTPTGVYDIMTDALSRPRPTFIETVAPEKTVRVGFRTSSNIEPITLDSFKFYIFSTNSETTIEGTGNPVTIQPDRNYVLGPFQVPNTTGKCQFRAYQQVEIALNIDFMVSEPTLTLQLRRTPSETLDLDVKLTNDFKITGKVSDPQAKVLVGGRSVALDNEGFFEIPFRLDDGWHLIRAVAIADGHKVSTGATLLVAQREPEPQVLAFRIFGLEDRDTVKTRQLRAHGVTQRDVKVFIDGAEVLVGSDLEFETMLDLVPGQNDIVAIVEGLGRREQHTLHIMCNPPLSPGVTAEPRIEVHQWTKPGVEYHNNLVEFAGAVWPAEAKVTANGSYLEVTPDGTFSLLMNAKPGQNNLNFQAVHQDQAATETISFVFQPPVTMQVSRPVWDGSSDFTKVPAAITGTVSDPRATVVLTYAGKTIKTTMLPNGNWYGTVQLRQGDEAVKATAAFDGETFRNAASIIVTPDGRIQPKYYETTSVYVNVITLSRYVEIPRGDSQAVRFGVHYPLYGPYGPVLFDFKAYEIEGNPLPDGVTVRVEPVEFDVYYGARYRPIIRITTTPEVPHGLYTFIIESPIYHNKPEKSGYQKDYFTVFVN